MEEEKGNVRYVTIGTVKAKKVDGEEEGRRGMKAKRGERGKEEDGQEIRSGWVDGGREGGIDVGRDRERMRRRKREG